MPPMSQLLSGRSSEAEGGCLLGVGEEVFIVFSVFFLVFKDIYCISSVFGVSWMFVYFLKV